MKVDSVRGSLSPERRVPVPTHSTLHNRSGVLRTCENVVKKQL
jgi:hypothetical protein